MLVEYRDFVLARNPVTGTLWAKIFTNCTQEDIQQILDLMKLAEEKNNGLK